MNQSVINLTEKKDWIMEILSENLLVKNLKYGIINLLIYTFLPKYWKRSREMLLTRAESWRWNIYGGYARSDIGKRFYILQIKIKELHTFEVTHNNRRAFLTSLDRLQIRCWRHFFTGVKISIEQFYLNKKIRAFTKICYFKYFRAMNNAIIL